MKIYRAGWQVHLLLISVCLKEALSRYPYSSRGNSTVKAGFNAKGLHQRRPAFYKNQIRLLQRLLNVAEIFEDGRRNSRGYYPLSSRKSGPSGGKLTELNRKKFDSHYHNKNRWKHAMPTIANTQKVHWRHRKGDSKLHHNSSGLCCSQRHEIIEPSYGRNRSGHIVELYKDSDVQQQFHEIVCDPLILNKPCKFLQGRVQKLSKCIQQHSYSYALVASSRSPSGWSLDHIVVQSGCTCKVFPSVKFNNQSHDHKQDIRRWKRGVFSRLNPSINDDN